MQKPTLVKGYDSDKPKMSACQVMWTNFTLDQVEKGLMVSLGDRDEGQLCLLPPASTSKILQLEEIKKQETGFGTCLSHQLLIWRQRGAQFVVGQL